MISKKKANYTMTKGFSILCKALIIYILFYFIIGAVLISVVPDDLSVYLRLTVTCITFITNKKSITDNFRISSILRLKLNKSYAFLVFDFIAIYYEVSFVVYLQFCKQLHKIILLNKC